MFVQTSFLSPSATIQKRLKKEKKAKRKLQEALEFESKRREQVEQALKQATSPESLRMSLNGGLLLFDLTINDKLIVKSHWSKIQLHIVMRSTG